MKIKIELEYWKKMRKISPKKIYRWQIRSSVSLQDAQHYPVKTQISCFAHLPECLI